MLDYLKFSMDNRSKSVLYLIPTVISENSVARVIPEYSKEIIKSLKFFISEDIRTTRRFLKNIDKTININEILFFELNKHTKDEDISEYLNPCEKGESVGLISEAGLPCIADPGNIIVKIAHQKDIRIVPLSGPSSIFMALMSSGFNGQNFAFNGYLPIDKTERYKKIKQLEQRSKYENQTQIFMETPFRNNKLFAELLSVLNSNTYLCVAANITAEDEFIKTKKISDWKKVKYDFDKKNCIFII